MDVFVFIHEADLHANLHPHRTELCFNYAEKLTADKVEFSVGGNAANTAVSFARLGFESQLYSMVGDDNLGEQIRSVLETEKVVCRYIQTYKGQTSYTTALIFQGERTLLIYHVPHNYQLPSFQPVDWLYLTSMGKAYRTAYDKVLTFVKKHKIKVSFNPGTFQLRSGVTSLKPFLTVTEVLFVNREEAQMLAELPASTSVRHLAEAVYDLGPSIVVITDGPKGSYCFDGEQLLFCDIFPIEVAERTGAGDSYASGFTAALLNGEPLDEAIRWGMANSAGVVSKVGPEAGLLTKSQMQEMLNDFAKIRPKAVRR